MNSRSLSTLAIFGFVMLGTICLGLRQESIRRDEAAREDTLWELTYDANFRALASSGQAQSQVRLATPFDTRHCQVIRGRETWIVTNPNLHAKVTRPLSSTGNRMLVFSTRQASTTPYEAKAKFVLRLSPRADTGRMALESLASRDRFLRPEVDLPTTDPGIRQMAQLVPADAQTDFERLQWVLRVLFGYRFERREQQSDDARSRFDHKARHAEGRARGRWQRFAGRSGFPRGWWPVSSFGRARYSSRTCGSKYFRISSGSRLTRRTATR